jgi:hypothetical protein
MSFIGPNWLPLIWEDPSIYENGHVDSVDRIEEKFQSSFEVEERKLKVWIDAFCMNQNDLAERAQEVK